MAKATFQAKLTLQNITPLDETMLEWSCDVAFYDADGAFTGYDVAVNDVIAVDTSGAEAGSFTLYAITSVTSQDFTNISFNVRYMNENDNLSGPPDLSMFVFNDCVISRPSPNYGLLPVVSRDIQAMNDKFTEYVQNYNFTRIVDMAMSDFSVAKYTKINRDSITLFKGMPVYISDSDFNNIYRATANGTHEQTRVAGLVADESILIDNPGRIVCTGIVQLSTAQWDALTGDTGGLDGGRDYFLRGDGGMGLTLTPPTTGFIVKVGKALSPTAFDVNIEPPIEL